jgi:DNA-binding NarL/FixJ family response regulator
VELDEVQTLVDAAQRRTIDIAILDLDHAHDDPLSFVRTLRHDAPDLLVLVVGSPLRAGEPDNFGHLAPEVDRAELVGALVHGFRAAAEKAPHRNWSKITTRQRDVMRWLACGLDNAAIGEKLHIGERAVKAHISSLLALFGLDNRTQLALLADRAGVRPPGKR